MVLEDPKETKMFDAYKYLTNQITVVEKDKTFVIEGIRTWSFLKEISKIFGSRISSGMIYQARTMALEIPTFFMFDFVEVLKIVIEKGQGRIFNKNLSRKILEEIYNTPTFRKTLAPVDQRFNRKKLSRFVLSPLPHQLKFFDEYEASISRYGLNGFILGAAPGTGKTLTSLYVSEMLEREVTVIISPSNALYEVWQSTLSNGFSNKTPSYFVYGKGEPSGRERYMVFSHDNMGFALRTLKKLFKPSTKMNIVLDECHGFTDMKSERTGMLIELCKYYKCQDILFMSGTPFKAMGAEILSFLSCADPLFNSSLLERFKKVYGASGNSLMPILSARIGRSMMEIPKSVVVQNKRVEVELRVNFKGAEEFTMTAVREKMRDFIEERVKYYQQFSHRYDSTYIETVEYFELTLKSQQEKALFQIYRKNVELIRGTKNLQLVVDLIRSTNLYEKKTIIPSLPGNMREPFREAKSVYKYVSLKIQGEALGRILGRERERCNVEILKNLDKAKGYCPDLELNGEPYGLDEIFSASQTKAIFFTDYVEVVKEAGKILENKGLKPQLVFGDTNKDLSVMINNVKTDPKANPFVATYKSLSTAVPLIMLDTCVFLNAPFRDYIRNQAESRIDRLGQKEDLFFYSVYLDTGDEPNISTRSKDILEWSKDMVRQLMGVETVDDEEINVENFVENFVQTSPETVRPRTIGW